MKIETQIIEFNTDGNPDLIDITAKLENLLKSSKLKNGILTASVIGSTAALTTFEFEPGLVKDMQELYSKIVPEGKTYHHDSTWGDANGYSHLRAALQGASLTIPFKNTKLLLGTWQQVVLAEFDNRPRHRKIAVQIIGE